MLACADVRTPVAAPSTAHVYHVYGIRSADRDGLQRHLQENGVQTNIHYPIPVHLQKAYTINGYREGDLPVTELVAREILSLPMYPELSPEQQRSVANAIISFRDGGKR